MNHTIEQLREYWKELGCLNPVPADEHQIAAFEDRYKVKLPSILREYFSVVNGTAYGQCGMEDADLISFWHLDQVRTLAEECPNDGTPDAAQYFVFADWMIWAHAWAVRLTDNPCAPTPVMIMYSPDQQVAPCFEEFLRRYLAGDDEVLFPEPAQVRPAGSLQRP